MLDQMKNFLIGLFVIAAFGIMTYIILFLHPTVGDEGQNIRARFNNIDKVSIGTRVLFAGHPVGEVSSIQEVEGARSESMLKDNDVYIYELNLQIDSDIKVFTSDRIMVTTSGLLGEKSVSIDPQPPKTDEPLVRVTDQIIYAEPTGSLEETMQGFTELSKEVRKIVDQVSEHLETIDEGYFWENISTTASNLADITTALNQPEDLRSTVHKVKELASSAQSFFAKAEKGEGTLGRLMTKDDLYLQVKSTLSKTETLMDDINHYGLLFHNDKGWQRLRARRANLMTKLCSPQEFRNFFNDEVNRISTSLSRVSNVLQKTGSPCCSTAVCSPEFTEVFADLLRRIEQLEENIHNYNEQIAEQKEKQCCSPKKACR